MKHKIKVLIEKLHILKWKFKHRKMKLTTNTKQYKNFEGRREIWDIKR